MLCVVFGLVVKPIIGFYRLLNKEFRKHKVELGLLTLRGVADTGITAPTTSSTV